MLKNRFVVFGLFFVILMSLNYYFTKALLPSPDTKNLWFYSGLFMMVFSILFIDPYYSSPKNVITNTIPLALTLIPIKDVFVDSKIWWVSFCVVITLLGASVAVSYTHLLTPLKQNLKRSWWRKKNSIKRLQRTWRG